MVSVCPLWSLLQQQQHSTLPVPWCSSEPLLRIASSSGLGSCSQSWKWRQLHSIPKKSFQYYWEALFFYSCITWSHPTVLHWSCFSIFPWESPCSPQGWSLEPKHAKGKAGGSCSICQARRRPCTLSISPAKQALNSLMPMLPESPQRATEQPQEKQEPSDGFRADSQPRKLSPSGAAEVGREHIKHASAVRKYFIPQIHA